MKRRPAGDSHFCNPDFSLLPRAELFIRMSAGLQNKPETHILFSASFESFPFGVSEVGSAMPKYCPVIFSKKSFYLFFLSQLWGAIGETPKQFSLRLSAVPSYKWNAGNNQPPLQSFWFSFLKQKYSFQLNCFITNGGESLQKQVSEDETWGSYCNVNRGFNSVAEQLPSKTIFFR